MIFGLRLEPSITEFGPQMTDILQIENFPFKLWKNLIKNLKILKIKNPKSNLLGKNFFEIFSGDPGDSGHGHSLF